MGKAKIVACVNLDNQIGKWAMREKLKLNMMSVVRFRLV